MSFPMFKAAILAAACAATLPVAASDTQTDQAMAVWNNQVRADLQRAQQYPDRAIALGLEGTVKVRVDVARDGKVTDIEVVETSGANMLDHAAKQMIRRLGKLPALSADMDSYSLVVPVKFRLAGEAADAEGADVKWRDAVRRRVASSLSYNNRMAANELEGHVKVRLVLDANGKVVGREIHQSSGNESLDAEVLHMAGRIGKLPSLPAGEDHAELVLPLTYRLAGDR
ncbi:MAG: TonB family protein [Alphaproteobacteria bacterium]|nr:MAG: TonB family protein [Alphaproteobacteria bacterium]